MGGSIYFTAAMIRANNTARSRGTVWRTQYVPSLLRELTDLKTRIIAAVKNIDAPMLMRVWQQLEYRIDVCRVTRGAQIEHI
jgi:hypothetical protein